MTPLGNEYRKGSLCFPRLEAINCTKNSLSGSDCEDEREMAATTTQKQQICTSKENTIDFLWWGHDVILGILAEITQSQLDLTWPAEHKFPIRF